MIDPRKFAKPNIHPGVDTFFRFGLDKDGTAAELRRFADAIEKGEVFLQGVQCGTTTAHDDYQLHAFMIEYAAREDMKPTVEEQELLEGLDSWFPFDYHTQSSGTELS
jgi:hypothetical protein